MAYLLSGLFKELRHNEGWISSLQIRICALKLTALCYFSSETEAFGSSSSSRRLRCFGSPLGGVLFGLEGQSVYRHTSNILILEHLHVEELDTFSNESDVMWRGFVTSVIAAMSLQYVDPFGTAKLVLFQVTSVSDTWRGFELVVLRQLLRHGDIIPLIGSLADTRCCWCE